MKTASIKSWTGYPLETARSHVYRPKTEAGTVYLKLMVIDDVLIVSFKEMET
jgi:motility quorum-sensing regulator / GCU-specific mRNA interferase toxin